MPDTLGNDLSRLSTRDYFIDAASFQLLSTVDMVYPQRDPASGHSREIFFSDYRLVNGILVPFSISETVVGQRTWTIQVNQITFNSGLRDTDFELIGN